MTVVTQTLIVRKECHKIRNDIKRIPKEEREEDLIEKLAWERVDNEQKLAAKDSKIGKIENEKVSRNLRVFRHTAL